MADSPRLHAVFNRATSHVVLVSDGEPMISAPLHDGAALAHLVNTAIEAAGDLAVADISDALGDDE